ncbi:helix-turn-helix domain-containing protein [Planococcus shixiaomingii]|uniref:helix-turn-helix domain-containing protein n=1 Tax=Planococcus shixiaomingii TaxID=3058393 RepID=UPI0026018F66|nr:helix-turn-helix transcriptional regulator [Planococcus sp. N022]WKA53435.1 helix-turn-helix transcriptional regulator [Planococcus sp. N022]
MVKESEIKKAFGNTLREFRKERKLSQEGLAENVGLHRTYISDIERGDRNISLINIIRICEELNIPASAFFSRMENGEKYYEGKSKLSQ